MTDLQQKVNQLQASGMNNPKAIGMGQQIDGSILNEVRDTVRIIKSETNTLIQKSVKEKFQCFSKNIFFIF